MGQVCFTAISSNRACHQGLRCSSSLWGGGGGTTNVKGKRCKQTHGHDVPSSPRTIATQGNRIVTLYTGMHTTR